MKTSVVEMKRVIWFRLLIALWYLIIIGIGFYFSVRYHSVKTYAMDFLIVLLLMDVFKIISPIMSCPTGLKLDFANEELVIRYILGTKQRTIRKEEIKRIEFISEEMKSIVKEPNYYLKLILKNGEEIKICLYGLKQKDIFRYEITIVHRLYLFVYFFGDLLIKDNKDTILREIRESLVRMKYRNVKMFFSELILKKLGMSLEDYTKELDIYDQLNWKNLESLKERFKKGEVKFHLLDEQID